MRRLLKEPLVHFVALGALLFAFWEWLPGPDADSPGEIVVTAGKVDNLGAVFEKIWRRPPTPDELDGLIRDHIREEVLVREGLALGLDRGDTVIRRRIRQKVEFLVEDQVDQAEPTEQELQAYLKAHPETFRVPPRYSFRQIYLDAAAPGPGAEREIERVLALLEDPDVDPSELGNRRMLAHAYSDLRAPQVARFFGADFAEALAGLPLGAWRGPIASGYGLHVVRVENVTPARMPPLDEIAPTVAREWAQARREEAMEKYYDRVLSRYRITVEPPE